MKTKFIWVALLASAALIAQAQAGGRYGGGGGGGGHFAGAHAAPARGGARPSFGAMPARGFNGNRMVYSGHRFSSVGMRSPSAAAFRQRQINANRLAVNRTGQFASGNINRSDRVTRFSQRENQPNRRIQGDRASQVRNGNNLRSNWRNHVFAQRSANWHRDWDRRHDHWWNGHRCHFINGSWVIFDFGFYPWWPYGYSGYYPYAYYGYPYGYGGYGYDYDPGYNDPGVYQGEEPYDQNGYDSSYEQNADSTVVAAQEQLAQQGYYHGEIDGVLGLETRRAILRYQQKHGLHVTGYLTPDTLQALGLREVARN